MKYIKSDNKIQVFENDVLAGEILWDKDNNVLNVQTTYVNPEFRSRKLGICLVDQCVEYARNNEFKIKPICSYVKHVFEKNEVDYKDVWEK